MLIKDDRALITASFRNLDKSRPQLEATDVNGNGIGNGNGNGNGNDEASEAGEVVGQKWKWNR